MTDWVKNLSKEKKVLAVACSGIGLSICAYTYYKYRKNRMKLISDDNPQQVLAPEAEDSFESQTMELDFSNEGWITPTASNDKLVCRAVNVEGELDDESPNKVVRTPRTPRTPVESDSHIDGYEEQKPNRKILILGLENSGKSALLSQLSKEGKNCVAYDPTKGFNVVCISFENLDLNLWEIGGAMEYRSYWKNFCASTDLILFAVDSCDVDNFPIAKHFLNEVIKEANEQSDFHIIATKADKEGSVSEQEIQDALGLDGMQVNILKVAVKSGGALENIGLDDVQKCCLNELEQ